MKQAATRFDFGKFDFGFLAKFLPITPIGTNLGSKDNHDGNPPNTPAGVEVCGYPGKGKANCY